MTALIAGAYPSYPSDPPDREEFLRLLGEDERFGGLELPVKVGEPATWPSGAPEHWAAVLTNIGFTMQTLATTPEQGLASRDVEGRRAAIEQVRDLLDQTNELKASGHPVIAVELHSAPAGGDPHALQDSLTRIASWDWGETVICLEHCDAPRPGHDPEKGFLELGDEISAVHKAAQRRPSRLGITINWARSVLEDRNVLTGLAHVAQAREAGVLAGLMFSSASPEQTSFGYPWIDAHLSLAGAPGSPESSVLTPRLLHDCLAAAGDLDYLGWKVGLDGVSSPADRAAAWGELANSTLNAPQKTRAS